MEDWHAERSGPVAGVVLAAGASSRMGTNKLLLQLGGESVLRRAVQRVLAAGLDPVLVVLGHEADRTRAQLDGLACRAVFNPEYARGMNSSLRAGIAAVPPEATAVVVALADMPHVTSEMIATLVERYRESGSALVASDYGGVLAPPTLYHRSLLHELDEGEGEGCGKRVVERHRAEATLVPWPGSALGDIDRLADYERIKSQLAHGG